MKLKRFVIRNYKALEEVDIAFSGDLLFLIGVNGAGKTSALQALSLVRYFAEGQPARFFKDRRWITWDVRPRTVQVDHLQSAANPRALRRQMTRNFTAALAFEHEDTCLLWEFVWSYTTERTVQESVWLLRPGWPGPRRIFGYPESRDSPDHHDASVLRWGDLKVSGSLLALASVEAISSSDDEATLLATLQDWAMGITSLELLSPGAMRRGDRGEYRNIGARGEHLAGFLANLPTATKARVVERLAEFYPVRGVDTTKKRAGWIDMKVAEEFRFFGKVDIGQMSDGFLRLLALCAIPEFGDSTSLVLLDEVEDGIEPHVLPHIIERINRDSQSQIVLTSHSPLLINFFNQDQIYLLARDQDGRTISARASTLPIFRRGHDFLGSGEIWANAQRASLQEAVRSVRQRFSFGSPTPRSADDVARFLSN